MTLQTGVCAPWISNSDVTECAPCAGVTIADATLTEMVAVASDVLYELSGRRFPGECEVTVRPLGRPGSESYDGRRRSRAFSTSSVGADGFALLWGGCGCSGHEDGRFGGMGWGVDELSLGAVPVTSITQVKLDGAVLASSAYELHDHRWLNRLDGDVWPCWQDLSKPDTQADTFSVKYKHGAAPPAAGVLAAKRLACELALSCQGSECGLPERVQTITRQGITMTLLDPQDFLDKGRTGLYEVDMFLKAYNPDNLRGAATVASPDIGWPARRVT